MPESLEIIESLEHLRNAMDLPEVKTDIGKAIRCIDELEDVCAQNANEIDVLIMAAREAQMLLTNYLVDEKFPKGSDCDEVLQILNEALKLYKNK